MKRILLSTAIIFLLFPLFAQDGHYWTQQYGTRSMLLSGSVIGGVEDLGSVYYNPGRLSQIENPAFIISADVYEYNRIRINDAFSDKENNGSSEIGGVPSLAAGTFKLSFLEGHHFAWAILVRGSSNLGFSYSNELEEDELEDLPGSKYFGTDMAIDQNMQDQWTGINWSYAINEKLSIGASGFLALYDQSKGLKINLHRYTDSSNTNLYHFNRTISLEQYSLIGKIGVSYKTKAFILGMTLVAPRLNLFGSGTYNYDEYFVNEGSPDPALEDIYTKESQSDLKTNYKSPLSIGLGVTFPIKRSNIHLSAEWYNSMPKYTIVEAEDHVSQSSGDTIGMKLVDKFNSVLNIGLGAEFYINEKMSGYLSASTDNSAVTSELGRFVSNSSEVGNSTFLADYYHYGGGVVLHLKRAEITLGATYTGATQDFERPGGFPKKLGENIFGGGDTAELEWDKVRVVFSFSLPILRDVQKKVEDKMGL